MAPIGPDEVYRALRDVMDPELPLSIVDMGLVYDVRVAGPADARRVEVDITFTAMGCPAMGLIQQDVRDALEGLAGVHEFHLRTVWDPPWSVERLSSSARETLRTAGVAV